MNIKKLARHKAVKNGIWLYLLQIFNSVIPLITLPYVTRILGKEMFGLFNISLNIIVYLQVVTEYGFIMSATRKVVLIGDNQQRLDRLFTCVVYSRLLLLIPCFAFSLLYVFINKNNVALCQSYLLLLLGLLGYCVQANWLFQGKQEMKYLSIVSMSSRLISLIIIFSTVKTVHDLPLYCIAYSATPIINGFFGLILAKHRYCVHFVKVRWEQVAAELREGWFVFTTQLSTTIFGSIGITFLGMFAVASVVGEYAAIQKIPSIILLIWAPISQVLYPISSTHMCDSFDKGCHFVSYCRKRILSIFILLTLIVAVLGKQVISVAFGAEYSQHYYWIFPLLLWVIIAINNNFWGIQILLASGHDKEYSECFQIGVMCTIGFNYVLIRLFGGLGASLAPAIAELVLGILLKLKVNKLARERN